MRAEALTCKISHVRLSPQSFPALCNPLGCNLPAPLSMGFSRQEHWSGLPFPPPRDLADLGIKPAFLASPALQAEPPLNHLGSHPMTKHF